MKSSNRILSPTNLKIQFTKKSSKLWSWKDWICFTERVCCCKDEWSWSDYYNKREDNYCNELKMNSFYKVWLCLVKRHGNSVKLGRSPGWDPFMSHVLVMSDFMLRFNHLLTTVQHIPAEATWTQTSLVPSSLWFISGTMKTLQIFLRLTLLAIMVTAQRDEPVTYSVRHYTEQSKCKSGTDAV